MRRTATCNAIFLSLLTLCATTAADEISFNRDVRPILSDRCFHCHGPDAENQESEFRLDSRDNALADLGGYAGVVPNDLKQSELHARIRSTDEDDMMPPPDAVRQLTEQEKDILDAWILAGAPFEKHWSFNSVPDEVDVPDSGADWARTEIDRFVFAELAKAGMQPNESASRENWLRRVTFDLTGLPPALEDIAAFLDDESDEAHARVVDRLLASEACGERLASEWLDVARYSDSYGYQRDDERFVWPYRDWVIGAFHDNMPYDEFITLQLAGDLLPDATADQILPTAFNRLHSHKKEGGIAIEEFRVENVSDRTHTVAAAFMGLTMECARCHDHKYDPTKTKEYYQLSSFFANIDERGLISYFTDAVPTPTMPLPSHEQQQELAKLDRAVSAAEQQLAESIAGSQADFEAWLEQRKPDSEIKGLIASLSFEELEKIKKEEAKNEEGKDVSPDKMHGIANSVAGGKRAVTTTNNKLVGGRFGKAIQLTGDDALVIPGVAHFSRHQPWSFSLWMNTPEIEERSAIFRVSRGWDDAGSVGYDLTRVGGILRAKLVHFWPGDAIAVETTKPLKVDRWYHVAVTYDGSSKAAGLKIHVDGSPAETKVVQDHLTRNITEWRNGYNDLAIGSRYRDRGFKNGLIDEFRVFNRTLSAIELRHLFDGHAMSGEPGEKITNEQRDELRELFLSINHEPTIQAREQLQKTRRRRNKLMDSIPAILVMREQAKPRPAYVLERGVYDSHGEEVSADTPAFLPPFPADQPRNRLGLARWLTMPNHPLTARVTVNRYWQTVFGNGLVRTPEDFGIQGEAPTHPALLDWLARDFMNNGWDLRRLLRTLVLSSTYRQSSIVSRELRDKDPENRLLSRGPAQRLSAEMVRDNALAVSGLLVDQVGGAPVKPYDVALAYTPLKVDKGDRLYRRSLYTFWKRTSPAPVMITMDANKREVCRLKREITASPLQALVLLNGPQFVEASRVLGGKLLTRHGEDIDAIVIEAFTLLTSRKPNENETKILQALFEEQLAEFTATPENARKLLKTGDAENDADIDPVRLAAATVLVNSIMNLDECVRQK